MAALLSPRKVLMAHSSALSTGGVVGVVLGVVFGLLLLFLCVFPFLQRARRQRRRREAGLTDEEGMAEGPYSHGFLGNSAFGDTLRRLSHHGSPPVRPPEKVSAGSDGGSAEKPDQSGYVPHITAQHGLPSPAPTPQELTFSPESLPGRALKDGRTATGLLTLGQQSTTEGAAPNMSSGKAATTEDSQRENDSKGQSISDSFASPSRQGTFGSHDITEEPDSWTAQGGLLHQSSHTRKRSGSRHLSESIRHFAHLASAAMRRDSTLSDGSTRGTGSIRSPVERPDVLTHAHTAPPIMDPEFIHVNTEAPGLAYDYYHPDPNDIPLGLQHSASYGPPLSIPDAFAEPSILPGTFISPTSATTVTPISPVSPAQGQQTQVPWSDPNTSTSQENADQNTATKSWPPRPLQRTGTMPLNTFMSDLPSPPLPSTEQMSVDPRNVMKPITRDERDFQVKLDLFKLNTPSPPAGPDETREISPLPTQPTPDPTPEPESETRRDWEAEITGDAGQSWLAPDIAANGGYNGKLDDEAAYNDIAMYDSEQWEQSPPGSTPPNCMTPYRTPHSMPTPDPQFPPQHISPPYPGTPSPQPVPGSSTSQEYPPPPSERPSQSPGQHACHECDRVFDQLHKLHHHTRYHERPHKCLYRNCDQRFGTKTHLDRHVNDKHLNTKRFYCYYPNCPYGPQGKGFPRKDNWKRHMLNKHDVSNPPEPVAVDCRDEIMGGQ